MNILKAVFGFFSEAPRIYLMIKSLLKQKGIHTVHVFRCEACFKLTLVPEPPRKRLQENWNQKGNNLCGLCQYCSKDKHTYKFRLKSNDWECVNCAKIMEDHGDMV